MPTAAHGVGYVQAAPNLAALRSGLEAELTWAAALPSAVAVGSAAGRFEPAASTFLLAASICLLAAPLYLVAAPSASTLSIGLTALPVTIELMTLGVSSEAAENQGLAGRRAGRRAERTAPLVDCQWQCLMPFALCLCLAAAHWWPAQLAAGLLTSRASFSPCC